ncbi:MAG: 3-deoxy-D-manno-octulosonic acid transferase [Opitutaceae bacterium]
MAKPERKAESAASPARNDVVRVVYQLLFAVLLLIASPFLILKMLKRGQWRKGFGQRLGFHDRELKGQWADREVIWINAVSMGEVNLAIQIIARLRTRLPGLKIVISTTTTTGMAELRKKLPQDVIPIYYPIDLRSAVRRTMADLRPRAIILIEADFWPNLLWEAREANIPVLLVNALILERAARRYRRVEFLFRPLFASFDRIFCADVSDSQRLSSLGFRSEAIHVVGHPKFDTAAEPDHCELDVRALLDGIGLSRNAAVILGGSTHAGEERLLAQTFLSLRQRHPDLFLILVPRHIERVNEVARELKPMGLRILKRTELPETPPDISGSPHCLIVNTIGELRRFYGEADIVFVGESFIEGGGQNPIEPAVLGKAILTGPRMETFKSILPHFLKEDALIQVSTMDELEPAISSLLDFPGERLAMGQRAREVANAGRGALDRTVDGIIERLGEIQSRPPRDRVI